MMKKVLSILSLFILIFSLSSCGSVEANEVSKNYFYFDSQCKVTIYSKPNKECKKLFDEINNDLNIINNLCDRYNEYPNLNNIYYINNNPNVDIEIDPILYDIIDKSLNNSKLVKDSSNNSVFTISIGKLTDLYYPYLHNEIDGIPSNESINNIPNFSDSDITLNDGKIKISSNISLDLGGVAKGYAASYISNKLDEDNIKYSLNFGSSNIYTSSGNPNKNNIYYVGLIHPKKALEGETKIYASVKLQPGQGIITSGSYQRYKIVNDKIYSHILDPRTHRTVDTDILSISLIMDDSFLGDIYSTSLFILGYDEAVNFLNKNTKVKAIIYKNDGTIYVSPSLNKIVSLTE